MYCQKFNEEDDRKRARPLSTTTPLSSLSAPVLVKEVKMMRMKLKASEGELEAIKRKLQKETVDIEEDVKVWTYKTQGLWHVLNNCQGLQGQRLS